MPPPSAAWRTLLQDPDVQRWHDNMAIRSEVTARERIRVLERLCRAWGVPPAALVAEARDDPKAFKGRVWGTVAKAARGSLQGKTALRKDTLAKGGLHRETLRNYLKCLKSWLAANDIYFPDPWWPETGKQSTLVSQVEEVPEPSELQRVLQHASVRGRVSIMVMAYGGVRPEVLGNASGTDGLRLGDLPDLHLGEEGVSFTRAPAQVVVREALSKTGRSYVTYIPRDACDAIAAYLNRRRSSGYEAEAMGKDSPLIAAAPGCKEGPCQHVLTAGVTREVRAAMRAAGLKQRPYVWRSYMRSRLLLAESEGAVSHAWAEFWHGHSGGITAVYTTSKRLSPEMLDQMRGAYVRCEGFLVPGASKVAVAPPDPALEQRLAALEDVLRKIPGFRLHGIPISVWAASTHSAGEGEA